MRFEKEDIGSFFRSDDYHSAILSERRALLSKAPLLYSTLVPEGQALLDETIEMARHLRTLPPNSPDPSFETLGGLEKLRHLGGHWEADFLLMKPDENGVYRLVAGSVCFPSHWDLGSKTGKSMIEIHAPVPDLNAELGKQIDGFLAKIKPGISWERRNWGLSRSPDLNLHPSLNHPRLDAETPMEQAWWRLEEQSLVSLPKTGGILFGIKLVIRPLTEIKEDPAARAGLIRALLTMNEEMAEYKGIAKSRQQLLELLER